MPDVTFSKRPLALRALLERPRVIDHASVWDAVSVRMAASLGFEMGLLGGSVASHAVLGAPDILLLTLSELAEQARRVTRASSLPVLVDADHGYGNALNVRRTVEELEAAGVAGLTIEDTLLPRRFGGRQGELIPVDEFTSKLKAALAARSDPALVVMGRTGALPSAGLDETLKRVRAAAAAGVDAVFVFGVTSVEQVAAIEEAVRLPLMINAAVAPYEELSSLSVRIVLQGHLPYFVALRALHDAYRHLREGGSLAALQEQALLPEHQAIALSEAEYAAWAREYLE
jgi:carboxyvinyl-carboxyphosphonate phosphorylmutase